jgi:hypothetical protein
VGRGDGDGDGLEGEFLFLVSSLQIRILPSLTCLI